MSRAITASFRNEHVAAPLKDGTGLGALYDERAFRNEHVAAPLKVMGVKQNPQRVYCIPQRTCCGPIEGRPSRPCACRTSRIPQRTCCGPIEGTMRVDSYDGSPCIPQRTCCGPIEGGRWRAARRRRGTIPQRTCCGPIEGASLPRSKIQRLSFRNEHVAAPLKDYVPHYGSG